MIPMVTASNIAVLVNRIRELEEQNKELQLDKARLDWLQEHMANTFVSKSPNTEIQDYRMKFVMPDRPPLMSHSAVGPIEFRDSIDIEMNRK